VNNGLKTIIGLIVGIITIVAFVISINSSTYGKIRTNFDDHLAAEFQEKIRSEHRLTAIEEQLKTTNRLLEEIKEELKK